MGVASSQEIPTDSIEWSVPVKLSGAPYPEDFQLLQQRQDWTQPNIIARKHAGPALRFFELQHPVGAGLKRVSLANAVLDAYEIRLLVNHLGDNQKLETLILNANPIKDDGIVFLRPLLVQVKYLKELNLSSARLSGKGLTRLGSLFSELSELKVLNVGFNSGSQTDLIDFLKCLFSLSKLEQLYLEHLGLRDVHAGLIGELVQYQHIEVLILSNNKLTSNGIESFVLQISSPKLVRLNLSFNSIGKEGFGSLVDLFASDLHLKSLSLSNNGIGSSAKDLILKLLTTNRTISTIDINEVSYFSSDFDETLFGLLTDNISFWRLNVCWPDFHSSWSKRLMNLNGYSREVLRDSKIPFYLIFHIVHVILLPELATLVKRCFVNLLQQKDLAIFFRDRRTIIDAFKKKRAQLGLGTSLKEPTGSF